MLRWALVRFVASAGCLLLLQGVANAEPRDEAERRIIAEVQAQHARSLELLERLVDINSGTMNFAGVERVGDVMKEELASLGFSVRWVSMSAAERAGHVIATRHSGRGPRFLLIGHLDTVFDKDSPFQSFSTKGDIATGPGVGDMKGGLVVMVAALRSMKAAGVLEQANITIVLSGDEERPGVPLSVARADLRAAGRASDIALDFEPMMRVGGKDVGAIARRSLSFWTLRASGHGGHSSQIFAPEYGSGAIYEMARILDEFRIELTEPYLTDNVGLILGGTTLDASVNATVGRAAGNSNVIPVTAFASGDLRTISDQQTNRVRDKMRAIVSRHLPHSEASIEFEDSYPAMSPTDRNRVLLAKLNAVNRDLDLPDMPEADPSLRGAGDISFVAADIDGLVGMGIAGEGAHSTAETADLSSLDLQAKRAALLIHRLSTPSPSVHR